MERAARKADAEALMYANIVFANTTGSIQTTIEGDQLLDRALLRVGRSKFPKMRKLADGLESAGAVLLGGGTGIGVVGYIAHAESQDAAIVQVLPELYKIGGSATVVIAAFVLIAERGIDKYLRQKKLDEKDLPILEKALAFERGLVHPGEISNARQAPDKISNYRKMFEAKIGSRKISNARQAPDKIFDYRKMHRVSHRWCLGQK
jgi:hypothetical protein